MLSEMMADVYFGPFLFSGTVLFLWYGNFIEVSQACVEAGLAVFIVSGRLSFFSSTNVEYFALTSVFWLTVLWWSHVWALWRKVRES